MYTQDGQVHVNQKKPKWLGRSLSNYIDMHKKKYPDVVKARSLTEARKICFGDKPKRAYQREQLYNEWKDKGGPGGPAACPLRAFTKQGR